MALINYGPDENKLCTVLDVVDENKVLVDGPVSLTGVRRHVINVRRLSLTDFTVAIPRQAREKTLKNAWAKAELLTNWSKTAWAKKLSDKKRRSELTDFDRFKVQMLRKQRSRIVRKKFAELCKKN